MNLPSSPRRRRGSFYLSVTVICHLLLLSTAFPSSSVAGRFPSFLVAHQARDASEPSRAVQDSSESASSKNTRYVEGLIENLDAVLSKYILSGSPATQQRAINIFEQIQAESRDEELVKRALRMTQRAGLPAKSESNKVLGRTDDQQRRDEAEQRKRWEASRTTSEVGEPVATKVGRSALSKRETNNGKPDPFLPQLDSRLDPKSFAEDKAELEEAMSSSSAPTPSPRPTAEQAEAAAAAKVSELVAQAGAGEAFEGSTLGIGGLDEVLSQVKRRVWTPLAAPPQLLHELGIHPVKGLLLYGRPGCGKSLLARKLGQLLSPLRPITVVSGPEVMDKFVGSSEKNLRDIFDNPPDIYDFYRIGQKDGGDSIARAGLHVIVMDEFDAVARSRGGRGGSGDQGDAGVARDSVVNQLLAKMDGVDPLVVPTLVIGLTNKRSLIDPALLRPGRFEVQVEVPPPRTKAQRISILTVHTRDMHRAGRLLVKDAPGSSAAARLSNDSVPTYKELLERLADECDGFSGASIAGVCRAAASHALERAVEEFTSSQNNGSSSLLADCVVTEDDFEAAVNDVIESQGDSDWALDEKEKEEVHLNEESEVDL